MKKRIVVTLVFDIDTKDYAYKQWFPAFNNQVLDVLRYINARTKIGVLREAWSKPEELSEPRRLDHQVSGPARADLPKVFTFCPECPNTSWCRTQGQCIRAEKVRTTPAPKPRTRIAKESK